MKKFIAILTVMASILVTIQAAENSNNWSVASVTFQTLAANKYLAFGSGTVLYDKPVLHSDLNISLQNGIYVDLWNSTPLNTGWNENYGTEVDLGLGWNGALSGIEISVGTSYFDEPKLATIGAGDSLYSHLTLTKQLKFLSVSVEYENYLTMPGTGVQGGNLYSVGCGKGMSFFENRLNATTSLALVYDDGGYAMSKGFLLRGFAELGWSINKHLTLVLPQLFYFAPITVNDSRKVDAMVYAGFRYKF